MSNFSGHVDEVPWHAAFRCVVSELAMRRTGAGNLPAGVVKGPRAWYGIESRWAFGTQCQGEKTHLGHECWSTCRWIVFVAKPVLERYRNVSPARRSLWKMHDIAVLNVTVSKAVDLCVTGCLSIRGVWS